MNQSPKTVALTGATGFVGRHVLIKLLDKGYRVRVLVRDASCLTVSDPHILPVHGDLFDPRALRRLVEDVQAVIHLVGIIMEQSNRGQTFERVHHQGTVNLIEEAKKVKVGRWIQMSALGVRSDAQSGYHLTKWKAEQAVRRSGMAHTIFRPSIIHGPDGEFMQMVKSFWCDPTPPFVPYFGTGLSIGDYFRLFKAGLSRPGKAADGNGQHIAPTARAGRLQPVWVDDVVECFVKALENDQTISEVYPMGGPDVLTWARLYEICGHYLPDHLSKPILAVPVWAANLVAGLPGVPFNADQVIMSQEESTCDNQKVESDFGIKLAAFEPTLAQYAERI